MNRPMKSSASGEVKSGQSHVECPASPIAGRETSRDLGGQVIGEGLNRTAYAVGRFVVKESNWTSKAQLGDSFVLAIGALGMRLAPTVRIGQWEVQLRYKAYDPNMRFWGSNTGGDLHAGNVGWDRRGRLVAFDW